MRVNYQDLNPEEFDVSDTPEGILIRPTKTKHKWLEEEKWLRSVMCEEDGRVISLGFPKFLNYHEDSALHDMAVQSANSLYMYPKLDGSLILVSLAPGRDKPLIRTRGSHHVSPTEMASARRYIDEHYLELFQEIHENTSHGRTLLFEFTGPENQIVVKYEEPKLTLLGVTVHNTPNPILLYAPHELRQIASYWGLAMPSPSELDAGNLYGEMQRISALEDTEGVVIGAFGITGPTLFKVKAEWYVRLHGIRTNASEKKINELLGVLTYTKGVTSLEDAREHLYDIGFDYETTEFIRPMMEVYYERLSQALVNSIEAVNYVVINSDKMDRGDFVKQFKEDFKEKPKWLIHAGLAYMDGKIDRFDACVLSEVTGESVTTICQHWFKKSPKEVLE